MRYLTKWSSRLAALVVRFDAVRLFPVGLRQVYGLCRIYIYIYIYIYIEHEIAAVSADVSNVLLQSAVL